MNSSPMATVVRAICNALEDDDLAKAEPKDIAAMLRELADLIDEQWTFLRKMDHSIQSTWKAVPQDIAQHYANYETIPTEDRLSRAVAQMHSRITDLEALLHELKTARPLLLYGDRWVERIEQTLKGVSP